jgi:glutamate-ammonia-ligase adenylyltransferase
MRLERLAGASPLYAQVLRREPRYCFWLEDDRNLRTAYRYQALLDEWRAFSAAGGTDLANDDVFLSLLRRWRRLMSLRIAYRSVNGFADEPTVVGELTRLAEFCLRSCLQIAWRRWTGRCGEPWDEDARRPARFGVVAFGKLGGGELNFSSDIDLIYCYEGEGFCRRDGVATPTANVECFTKVAETVTRLLAEPTADGFLFRVDARLRPEGSWGPLVHSLSALENYYATSGQTWERLALIKARPVAGDLALGAELLEDLHPFRYPRRPPPSLLSEVAAMKRRTEREAAGSAALGRNVKLGPGGIREIEFIAQSLQLLHAGGYPFLQTNATVDALEGLARYRLLDGSDARLLCEAYWFLRRVEHRLQMRDERQTHDLPADEGELSAVASSLGFASAAEFREALDLRRGRVHALYAGLFADRGEDSAFEAWWEFLTTEKTPALVATRLERWFGDAPGAAGALRLFACGDRRRLVTRELVTRFQHLAESFDALMPELAQPLETLARLARCAERYGTRQQFLNGCASNPHLLRVLALLCDRSGYSAELLCAHPEILEEVLRPATLRRRKTSGELAAELSAGPSAGSGRDLRSWLWLYVRAEQMRYLICELLGFITLREAEEAFTRLADAVLSHVAGPGGPLVVGLGKYGGGELAFGSDLDLLFVAEPGSEAAAEQRIDEMTALLQHGGPLGPAFALDLRLRPHGEAGPRATTLRALGAYHAGDSRIGPGEAPAPSAQTWEKQMLARARVIAGPAALASGFRAWTARLLYANPLRENEEAALWAMRARVGRERDSTSPPERSIKTGPGGLLDVEFLVQDLQLRHGSALATLRTPGTRAALAALAGAGILPAEAAARLRSNYDFLLRVQFALRRDANRGVGVLPASAADRALLAKWLGSDAEGTFWEEHVRRMRETRSLVLALAGPAAQSALQP